MSSSPVHRKSSVAQLGRRALLVQFSAAALGAGCAVGSTRPASPASAAEDWAWRSPADANFETGALGAVLRRLQSDVNPLHGLLIERGGQLVAELYRKAPDRTIRNGYGLWPWVGDTDFGVQTLHDMRSISKSVVSLLFGIALGRGEVSALTTPVLDYFPEHASSPELRAVQLRHLLDMTSGWDWKEGGGIPDDETRLFWTRSISEYVLSRPIAAAPGTHWNYNGGCTALLAEILQRRHPGLDLAALAERELWQPLGIRDWEWVRDLHGRPLAFAGLRLRPRDLLKLGRLMLAGGRWAGRQLVPADWVAASMTARMDTAFTNPLLRDEHIGYAHQWWQGRLPWRGQRVAWTAGVGLGGQRLFMLPALDLGVVMTAGAYFDPQIGPLELGWFAELVGALRA